MPVDLTKLPQSLLPLKKFSWWFWAILLLALVVTGCFITFVVSFFYSISDLLLVLCSVVVPIGLWMFSLLYGIYYRGYCEAYIKQWNIYRDKRQQQLIDYARRGLYVLQFSLITEYGKIGSGNGVANAKYAITTKPTTNGCHSVAYSSLPLASHLDIGNYYERLKIILAYWRTEHKLLLTELPIDTNIHVRLFIDTELKDEKIEELWLNSLGKLIHPASFSIEDTQNSALFTQQWLDNSDYDGDLLLLINAHLFNSPSQNEAEEALLMLFAGEQAFKKLADVIDTEQVAKIYRSEQTGELAKTLDHALLWGQEDKKSYDGVWYSGVSNQQNIDIMKHFNDIEFEPGGIFNIDTTIGNAKNSAYFFALALAVEYAQSTGNKQLIVVGEPDITASVVTTVAKK
ncbi:hypothetical protein [Orbus mooreae]|uniref:hypothetical protein n=1 Tax=Orbus mooreae TaxID=3074107 RepID=UPI00370D0C36